MLLLASIKESNKQQMFESSSCVHVFLSVRLAILLDGSRNTTQTVNIEKYSYLDIQCGIICCCALWSSYIQRWWHYHAGASYFWFAPLLSCCSRNASTLAPLAANLNRTRRANQQTIKHYLIQLGSLTRHFERYQSYWQCTSNGCGLVPYINAAWKSINRRRHHHHR